MGINTTYDHRTLNQPQRVDNLIKHYNSVWLNKGIAWIVKDETNKWYAVKDTLDKGFFSKATLADVKNSMDHAISFLNASNADIYRENQDHVDFLARISSSFSLEKSRVHIDQIRIEKVIAQIRASHLAKATSSAGSLVPIHDRLQTYPHRLKPEDLPHINFASYRTCDIIFLLKGTIQADENKLSPSSSSSCEENFSLTPIPAHHVNVLNRNEFWKNLPIEKNGHEISLTSFDIHPKPFLTLLTAIYKESYPVSDDEVAHLRDCATLFQETEIAEKCNEILINSPKTSLWRPTNEFYYLQKMKTTHPCYERLKVRFVKSIIGTPVKDIPKELVDFIVGLDSLPISEDELLTFLEKYAEEHKDGPSVSIAQYLQQTKWVKSVRCEWMSTEVFVKHIVLKDYLSPKECCRILKLIATRNQKIINVSTDTINQPRPRRQKSWVEVIDCPKDGFNVKLLKGRLWVPRNELPLQNIHRHFEISNTFHMRDNEWQITLAENAVEYNNKKSHIVYGLRLISNPTNLIKTTAIDIHGKEMKSEKSLGQNLWRAVYFETSIENFLTPGDYFDFELKVKVET